MGKKLYVGNLSYNATEDDLKGLFSPYGTVSEAAVIRDRMSGRSKGFGFVTLDPDDGADKAKTELNGKEWQGRPLKVDDVREQQGRPPRGPRPDRFGGGPRHNRGF